jgi:hypothetical protein
MAEIINPQSSRRCLEQHSRRLVMDPGSPVMTAIAPITPEGTNRVVGWACGWFNTTYTTTQIGSKVLESAAQQWNLVQLPLECLVVAEETIQ